MRVERLLKLPRHVLVVVIVGVLLILFLLVGRIASDLAFDSVYVRTIRTSVWGYAACVALLALSATLLSRKGVARQLAGAAAFSVFLLALYMSGRFISYRPDLHRFVEANIFGSYFGVDKAREVDLMDTPPDPSLIGAGWSCLQKQGSLMILKVRGSDREASFSIGVWPWVLPGENLERLAPACPEHSDT